ncbi:stromal membrane-associated protein [Fistulifera solaris]|uniref:Stromal membrane-associated protein n=1 Tax=Fistulifera solaris TaxID=1519565 RepID=A0A1Z5JHI0_FISSO|nr:stromal membrane-associated protein [Fistulifera solaris]|eukprot:GAX13463.1 stromal membrane-associated protein [Fistulifera solaris]
MADDQKVLKKRLKVLMSLPENQVCSDCPERQPRWASLIVPPPGAPPGSLPIGAFCCLECSGSHRRLGVHISFVRSINLDSWKEKEVLAMENGGNLKVNAIFEANLARSGVQKPSNHADGPTRERFIRDKYERRKFYDPVSFSNLPAPASVPTTAPQAQAEVGPPSDAARQRMEQRRLRKIQSAPATEETRPPPKPTRSSSTDRPRSRTPPRLNAKPGPRRTTRRQPSDESLEKEMDLLDLNFVAPATETKPNSSSSHDLFNFLVVQDPAQNNSQPKQPPKSSTLDIMSLYGSNNNNSDYQRQNSLSSFGNLTVSNIMDDASSMNSGGYTAQQMQQMNMRPNMMPNVQQQQMIMMQQQQQMMMMQQQQQQQQRMMMMQNNAMNGFGTPMGSGPPVSSFQGQTVNKAPEKEDPFAQFGVNHFR